MTCPACEGKLRKPTLKEKMFSLLIFYSQTTHVCEDCKELWEIRKIPIPKSMSPIIEIPSTLKKTKIISNLKQFL